MIVITGASRGIGKFLFEKYISENKAVLGTYLHSIPEKNQIHYHKLDVVDYSWIEEFVTKHSEVLKRYYLDKLRGYYL